MSNPLKNDASRRRCGRAGRRCEVRGQEWDDREDLLHRHTFYCNVFVVREKGLSDTVATKHNGTQMYCVTNSESHKWMCINDFTLVSRH